MSAFVSLFSENTLNLTFCMDKGLIKDSYKSIAAEARGLFKDNGSKFIAHAYPVETEEEVKEIVAALKKEYYDARHHVYAYRLGYMGDKFRANDDGEPSGSSGRPVLGQIDSNGLSDILVVVVRYFGGIKLGIPGLIRAYKTSTADAIANAQIVEKIAAKIEECIANPDILKTIEKNLDAIRNKDILENTYKLLDSLGTAKYTKDFDYLKDYKKCQIKKDVKNMLKAAAKKAKEAKETK